MEEGWQAVFAIIEYRRANEAKQAFNNKSQIKFADLPQRQQALWADLSIQLAKRGYLRDG